MFRGRAEGGPVMSRFSPEAFQVAYRPGIRARVGKGERAPVRDKESGEGARGEKTEGEERT